MSSTETAYSPLDIKQESYDDYDEYPQLESSSSEELLKMQLEKMTTRCYELLNENNHLKLENNCLKNRLQLIGSMANPDRSLLELETSNMDYQYDMPEEIGIDREANEKTCSEDESLIEPMEGKFMYRRSNRQKTNRFSQSSEETNFKDQNTENKVIPAVLYEHCYSKITYNPGDHIPWFTEDHRYPEITIDFLLECHDVAEKRKKLKRSSVDECIHQDRVFVRLLFHRLFTQRELIGRSATGRITRYNSDAQTLEIDPAKKSFIREKLQERVQALDPDRVYERCSYSRLIRWFSMFVHSRNNGYKRTKSFIKNHRTKKKQKPVKKNKSYKYVPEVVFPEYYDAGYDNDTEEDQPFVKLEI